MMRHRPSLMLSHAISETLELYDAPHEPGYMRTLLTMLKASRCWSGLCLGDRSGECPPSETGAEQSHSSRKAMEMCAEDRR